MHIHVIEKCTHMQHTPIASEGANEKALIKMCIASISV